jgi:hypothetical protein
MQTDLCSHTEYLTTTAGVQAREEEVDHQRNLINDHEAPSSSSLCSALCILLSFAEHRNALLVSNQAFLAYR